MRSTNCMNRPELAPFTTPKSEGLKTWPEGPKIQLEGSAAEPAEHQRIAR